MKKLFTFLPLLLVFASCDKVTQPNQNPPAVTGCIGNGPTTIVMSNSLTSNYRKVLLEDFTGHTCPNCPRAAEAADALIATYQSSLVVIANHVSVTFAAPRRDSSFTYREDFRNSASTAWDVFLGMSNAGLPKGCVNRMGSSNYAQNYSAWSSMIPFALNKPQVAKLDITSKYDISNHYLNVSVKTTFKTALDTSVKMIILLTQDSIIAQQKDGAPPVGAVVGTDDPGMRLYYRFDNIVIGALNGDWGGLVKKSPITLNDTVTVSSSCYLVDKCFTTVPKNVCLNDRHIYVVAFIYTDSDKIRQVLQVEKLKIR